MHDDESGSDLHKAISMSEAKQMWKDMRTLTDKVIELGNAMIRVESQIAIAVKLAEGVESNRDKLMQQAQEIAVMKSDIDVLKKICYGLIGTILLGVLATAGTVLIWGIGHLGKTP